VVGAAVMLLRPLPKAIRVPSGAARSCRSSGHASPANATATVANVIEGPMNKAQPIRVFLGIKIAPETASQLAELARPLEGFPVRLVPSVDLHLTLVPPWNETSVSEAVEKLVAVASGLGSFLLVIERLRYGPTRRDPHLLWAECAASNELAVLRSALLRAFGQTDPRPFQAHVTLARIPRKGRIIAQEKPMDDTLSLTQPVVSVELFQSPPKGQSGYQVLASLPLGAKVDGEPAAS
jgi:2'-5' RNA ligase